MRNDSISTIGRLFSSVFFGQKGRLEMGRKQEKAEQRKRYKEAFKGVKHGHGTRPIRKKEEAALGK